MAPARAKSRARLKSGDGDRPHDGIRVTRPVPELDHAQTLGQFRNPNAPMNSRHHISRRMRLTPRHLDMVASAVPDPGPVPNRTYATEADYAATIKMLLADRPASGAVWVFAYGSLIWNPACDVAERKVALLHGWHRSFCLGWDRHFRGSLQQPGLMLVLDRGGACRGVIERLPDDAVVANLTRLLKREMFLLPSPMPPRWATVRIANGACLRAITFAIDRSSGLYVGGLPLQAQVEMLATANGKWGSMAEYLHNTVAHLEAENIHDRRLWQLQDLVARRIEDTYDMNLDRGV